MLIVGTKSVEKNVVVYEFSEGAWNVVAQLPSQDPQQSIATDGITVVVGMPRYNNFVGVALVYGPGVPASIQTPFQSSASAPIKNLLKILFLLTILGHLALLNV